MNIEKVMPLIVQKIEFLDEITIEVAQENLKTVLQELYKEFRVLMDLTAVDYPENNTTKVIYLLHKTETYEKVRVVCYVERLGTILSVIDIWEGADWYERELYDFFGIRAQGHPDLKRILMPDDWKGHPLLRDYALTEEIVEFKHEVKPKVPSEIIPYVSS